LHIDILNYQLPLPVGSSVVFSQLPTHTYSTVAVASSKQLSSGTVRTVYKLGRFQEQQWAFDELK